MEEKQILEFIGELKEVSDIKIITEKFKKLILLLERLGTIHS